MLGLGVGSREQLREDVALLVLVVLAHGGGEVAHDLGGEHPRLRVDAAVDAVDDRFELVERGERAAMAFVENTERARRRGCSRVTVARFGWGNAIGHARSLRALPAPPLIWSKPVAPPPDGGVHIA